MFFVSPPPPNGCFSFLLFFLLFVSPPNFVFCFVSLMVVFVFSFLFFFPPSASGRSHHVRYLLIHPHVAHSARKLLPQAAVTTLTQNVLGSGVLALPYAISSAGVVGGGQTETEKNHMAFCPPSLLIEDIWLCLDHQQNRRFQSVLETDV